MNRIEPIARQLLNIPFIDNSMSYYELISKLMGYINLLIDSANGQDNQIEELRNLYNQLSDFLETYVNSGEFTEALGDKLDELATNGTLANIINNQIFSDLNTSIANIKTNIVSREVYIEDYRQPTDTDSTLLNRVLAELPANSTILFNGSKTYVLEQLNKLTKNHILDFRGAYVQANTLDTVFTIGLGNERMLPGEIKNFVWIDNPNKVPTCLIKFDDGINWTINGKFDRCRATHSLIWNYKGYGNKMLGEARYTVAPRVIYLSNNGLDIHSYFFEIKMDITGASAVGIEIEGGNGAIESVIESCVTGIKYNAISIISALNIRSYFENNTEEDLYLGDNTGSQANITLDSCFFTRANLTSKKAVNLGRRIWLTVDNCFFNHAGIYEIASNISAASKIYGRKNAIITGGHADFTTHKSYISDGIYDKVEKILLEGQVNISAYDLSPASNNVLSLGTQAKNLKDLWLAGIMYLPTYTSSTRPTPSRGGAQVFDVTLNKVIHYYSGAWYDAMGNQV